MSARVVKLKLPATVLVERKGRVLAVLAPSALRAAPVPALRPPLPSPARRG